MTYTPPEWWGSLAEPGAELGIDWLDPGAFRPADDLGDDFDQSPRTIVPHGRDEYDRAQRAGRFLVGTGPSVTARLMGFEQDVHWYADEKGGLWCALAGYYPAWLWVEVAPTADGLREVLSTTFPRRDLFRTGLPASARGFLGYTHDVEVPNVYSGEFTEINGHDLDRYFLMVAYTMQGAWGSRYVDDPLRTDIGFVKPLEMMGVSRGSLTQRLGRVPSMTWRTMQSQSYLSVEIHTREVVCAAVRYEPAPASHRATVERLNAEFDTAYPVDLPLDVIGALTGFTWGTEETLAHNLAPDVPAGQVGEMVRVMYALRHDDLGAVARLREFARHPESEVRDATVRAAAWYGHHFLLYEALAAETDPQRRAAVVDLIQAGGFGPDTFNAFGDYFGDEPVMIDDAGEPVPTWATGDEDEDDEDEDES